MTSDHGPELTDGDLERIANDIMQRHVVLLTDATRLFDGYVALRTQVAALTTERDALGVGSEWEAPTDLRRTGAYVSQRWLRSMYSCAVHVDCQQQDCGHSVCETSRRLRANWPRQAHATRAASAAGDGE